LRFELIQNADQVFLKSLFTALGPQEFQANVFEASIAIGIGLCCFQDVATRIELVC
jgi:hypothetical protein